MKNIFKLRIFYKESKFKSLKIALCFKWKNCVYNKIKITPHDKKITITNLFINLFICVQCPDRHNAQ